MEKEKRIFPVGIRTFERNAKAPEFILGTAVITIDELYDWCKEHPELITQYNGKDQLKLTILKDKEKDRINFQVDTYKNPNTER